MILLPPTQKSHEIIFSSTISHIPSINHAKRWRRSCWSLHPTQVVRAWYLNAFLGICHLFLPHSPCSPRTLPSPFSTCSFYFHSSWTNRVLAANDFGAVQVRYCDSSEKNRFLINFPFSTGQHRKHWSWDRHLHQEQHHLCYLWFHQRTRKWKCFFYISFDYCYWRVASTVWGWRGLDRSFQKRLNLSLYLIEINLIYI